MTDIDLNALSLAELKQLEKSVAKAIASFEDRRKAEARAAAEAVAKQHGFSLGELAEMTKQRCGCAPLQAACSAMASQRCAPKRTRRTFSGGR